MTLEDAIHDEEPISLERARAELKRHYCRIIATNGDRFTVTNDIDDPEEIACTPAAILAWLGY